MAGSSVTAGAGGGGTQPHGGTGAGSGGGVIGGAGVGVGGSVDGPPMRLADDESGITGLEDCALAQAGACVKPLTRSKDEVCQRWAADRPQVAQSLQMPAASDCDPGTTVDASLQDALRRLNLFRWLTGAGPLSFDDEWNAYARACAIIQTYISPDISHYPEDTVRCYTELGSTASAQSMLAGGSINPSVAIDDLIFDTGDNNFHVLGHRQGMLRPGLTKVGIGFAGPDDGSPATCVRMFDDQGVPALNGLEGVYSFPAPGYTPWEAIARSTYPVYDYLLEWSMTVPDEIELSAAKVRLVRREGKSWREVPVTSGQYTDDRFHGLWIIPGVEQVEPGVYAIIVSGSSLPTFGYQLVLGQCDVVPTTCDTIAQDCGAGIGCYDPAAPFCRKSGKIPVGEACRDWDNGECEPGAICSPDIAGTGYSCARYCDPLDASSAKSCEALCPNLFIEVSDLKGEVAGAYCFGGIGDTCDPLAPSCKPGQSCFGYDPPVCRTEGTTPAGQECSPLGGSCAAGATCVAVQGSGKFYCQPYCDPDPTATGAKACGAQCPDNFWTFDDFGLCIPAG